MMRRIEEAVLRTQVGPIFRKREGGGHPAEEVQGQFDIVCEARHALPEILEVTRHKATPRP